MTPFSLNIVFPKILLLLSFIISRVDNDCYRNQYVRHLNERIGEHIGILPLTKKQIKQEYFRG